MPRTQEPACIECGSVLGAEGPSTVPGAASGRDDVAPPNPGVSGSWDDEALGTAGSPGLLEDVSEFSVHDFESHALLRWSWPAGCSQVTLAWRSDRFPIAPGDRRALSRRVTRAEYDRHGGVQLEGLAATPHWFVVFAMRHLDGALAFAPGTSAGARCTMRRRTAGVVFYRLQRQWLRRRRVTLELRTEVVIENLPPLVVIAKPGELQPLHPEDGTVLLQLSWVRLAPDEPIRRDLDLQSLRTPLYLRAFFLGTPSGGRYRLIDPARAQLKVS